MESADGSSRDTSVLVVTLESNEVYIIISLSIKKDTQVINVDPTTGSLRYLGKPGHDLFNSEEEALNYITDESRLTCRTTTQARAILGYAALGNSGLLLVATKLNATVPNLPGGGCVYTVTESQWIKIQLQNPQPQGKGELKNVQELSELDINGKYYFCETMDLTRPFPSPMTCHNPDGEFVWNGWFSKPFNDIGLPKHCVILLQGFAECRNIGDSGQGATVALLARRSRLHPGTRYLARGLNSCSSTGNEVECEQLVWIQTEHTIPFSSYVWRRGTIPIWWGAELKFSAVDAEIYVSANNPYRGSVQYYQRLSQRYGARDPKLSTAGQMKTPLVPIICVNLLRYGEGKPETILVDHFKESLEYIKSTGKLSYTWIQLINYDWHATVKSKGEQQTVEGLWKLLKAPTIDISFAEGNYFSSMQRLNECEGSVILSDDFDGGFCLRSLQNGVVRFNCADSLDRTNAASYFGSVQVFVEQCRRLGISLDRDANSSENAELGNYGEKNVPLPHGLGEQPDTVPEPSYTIDHKTHETNGEHPCTDKPWKRFDMSFDQFKSSTMLAPINHLADLFLLAGDIHATLYTGSKAMHSQILNIFSDVGGGKYSKFSVAQNVRITLQRRYQNVLVDSWRQKQLEMFLGIRLFKHLPSVPVHPLKVLTRPSGCFLKPIPSIVPNVDGGSSLLSFKRKDLIWVCPPSADVVELFIYLGEPCHVSHLLLTVSHGVEDSSYPATMDIRTGCNLDELKFVLELPDVIATSFIEALEQQCQHKTLCTGRIDPEDIAITGNSARLHAQENSCLPLLYNFEELEGEINFLTRIVALTFYTSVPGRTPLTLGEIEVLGVSLPWTDIFAKNMNGAKYFRETHEHTSAIHRAPYINGSKNPSLRGSFAISGHDTYSSSESVVQSAQPCATSHGSDNLTGDLLCTDSPSQPQSSSVAEGTVPSIERIVDCFEASNLLDQSPGGNNNCDSTGHDTFSSSGSVVQSSQPCADGHGSDNLTGDLLCTDSPSQPQSSSVAGSTVTGNDRIVDCFDASNLPDQSHGVNNNDDITGHDTFSSSETVVQSSQPCADRHGNDNLTGDLLCTDSPSQPQSSSVGEGIVPSNEIIVDCFNASNLPDQSSGGNNNDDSIAQYYIDCFKFISTPNEGKRLDFLEAMKLEIERLRLNLSAAGRDKALSSIGINPASIDPNRLLDDLYMVKLCKSAGNLALLGQTAFEDRIIASSGLDVLDNNVIDFWNISNFGETCSGTTCEVQTEVELSAKASSCTSSARSLPFFLECSQCGRKTCKVCCAGIGASLSVNSNNKDTKIYNGVSSQSGSNHGGYGQTNSGHSDLQNGVICKLCCNEVILHALYVDYVRVLSSLRRQNRADNAAYRAVDQVVGHNFNRMSTTSQDQKVEGKLLDGEESLAEFPYASLLHLVETAPSSEPLMSLLAPLEIGEKHSYWRAPCSSSSVEFSILLGDLYDVSGVALIVSSCGYSISDCPMVEIWASNKIQRGERSYMGKWDIQSLISSSPHLFGLEKASAVSEVPRNVKFHFPNPVRCQIIWIALTLPQTGSSLNVDGQYDQLSLDDTSIPKATHASFGGTLTDEPFIHAKRILVFGKSSRAGNGHCALIQNPEMMEMRSFVDRSPQLGRFRVPIEGERLTENELVLEQHPSPNAPGIAGFRLDAFSVIKPRITHSPSSLDVDIWQSPLTHLEDSHISPALLFIQVSIDQEPRNVIIGEYRLPEVRAGTALYFDFPRPIQIKRIIFKLLGDVAAFADDLAEQDGSNLKARPLASGLSLSNRIKLYYYANPSELGKLASLSAV